MTQFSTKRVGFVSHEPKTDILPWILKLTIMNRTFLNVLNCVAAWETRFVWNSMLTLRRGGGGGEGGGRCDLNVQWTLSGALWNMSTAPKLLCLIVVNFANTSTGLPTCELYKTDYFMRTWSNRWNFLVNRPLHWPSLTAFKAYRGLTSTFLISATVCGETKFLSTEINRFVLACQGWWCKMYLVTCALKRDAQVVLCKGFFFLA